MNFRNIFTTMLQGGANGAVQGLQATPADGKVNWQGIGIVALFGAIVGLSQALASHPAVVAAQPAVPAAQ